MFLSVPDIEAHPATLLSLPMSSEKLVAMSCSTPVMQVILPCLCDGTYIIAFHRIMAFSSSCLLSMLPVLIVMQFIWANGSATFWRQESQFPSDSSQVPQQLPAHQFLCLYCCTIIPHLHWESDILNIQAILKFFFWFSFYSEKISWKL